MPEFGERSKKNLASCHPDLQRVLKRAIKITDFSVICGHRLESDQFRAFENGSSKLEWPDSKHNSEPSRAVDIVPYPINWPNMQKDSKAIYAARWGRFHYLAGVIQAISSEMGIKITWGGNWNQLMDGPHFELDDDLAT